jgi:hypothetical protein
MPKVYALPGSAGYGETHTFYRTFVGGSSMAVNFSPVFAMPSPGQKGLFIGLGRIADIMDGTSNTILAAEADEAVPWTKPDELAYDPTKPVPKSGFFADDYCHVLMSDGQVRRLKKGVPEKVLRNLITRADGNAIDFTTAFRDPQRSSAPRPMPAGKGK